MKIGFSYEKIGKNKIVELLEWDDVTLAHLRKISKSENVMNENKNRMICYLFESILELCLDKTLILSSSVGYEKFIGVHHGIK